MGYEIMTRIYDFRINGTERTLGVAPGNVMFSWKADRGERFDLSLFCEGEKKAEFSSLTLRESIAFYPDFSFGYGKEYVASVKNEYGDRAGIAFGTAEKLCGKWLVTKKEHPVFRKTFDRPDNCRKARLTIAALGLYVPYLNGVRLGENYLAPGMNDYDDCVRYQTYDLSGLKEKDNVLEVFVGNGWYKGRFGIDGHGDKTWGDDFCLIAEISLYGDTLVRIPSDETWLVSAGKVTASGIYDGEIRDDTRELSFHRATVGKKNFRLVPEDSPQITVYEEGKGELIVTPKGESVVDFHQNAAGIVRFRSRLKKGEKIRLQFGEVLQDGCFYRENLRTAKAEYVYVSDGEEKEVEPLFTFYGFRYMKVECEGEWAADDFTARYLSSEMKNTLFFRTDNPLLDRLIENVRRGQRSNFLDVPTDCPQRDERLGWTADTQVFAPTACYNGNAYAFYKKYICDLTYDQQTYYRGDFPMYSPSLKGCAGPGGAVWADAGVFVPWTVYRYYGDKKLLKENYPSMKTYVDKLIAGDEERGDGHILKQPFTFGDWLAQDGICPQSLRGGTDDDYIRSAYYYRVVRILAEAGKELGLSEAERYEKLSGEILSAIRKEYFTDTGRLALDTQAAYVVALAFGLYTDRQKVVNGFRERLKKDLYRIKCGFVGGPVAVQTMFGCGMEEEGLRMLFNRRYPGWFHEIELGATTVWERWNSLDEKGNITGTSMNSLNHYAYGAVAEGVYAYIGGISPAGVGWEKARIAPVLSAHVKQCDMRFDSPYGAYACRYRIDGNSVRFGIAVPHGCSANVLLPLSGKEEFVVTEGSYEYEYDLSEDILHPYNERTKLCDLLANEKARELLKECLPGTYAFVTGENEEFLVMCLAEMTYLPMFAVSKEGYAKFCEKARKIEA